MSEVNYEEFEFWFSRYRDADGFISNVKNPPVSNSGNNLLYTSEYYVIKTLTFGSDGSHWTQDHLDFNNLMNKVLVKPGLYKRTPTDTDNNAQDDYIGIVAASRLLATNHRFYIHAYGKSHNWVFDITGTNDRSTWFWRYPAFLCHVDLACQYFPAMWKRIWWSFSVATAGIMNKDSQDERFLSWLMIVVYKWSGQKSWIMDWASSWWQRRFHIEHPEGMGKLAEKYFNCEHALAKYWTGVQDVKAR